MKRVPIRSWYNGSIPRLLTAPIYHNAYSSPSADRLRQWLLRQCRICSAELCQAVTKTQASKRTSTWHSLVSQLRCGILSQYDGDEAAPSCLRRFTRSKQTSVTTNMSTRFASRPGDHGLQPGVFKPNDPADSAPAVHTVRWVRAALFVTFLLSLALRVRGLVAFPYDQDELYTIVEARDLFHTALKPGIDSRPLYYLLQHPLLDLLPQTEVGLRLLPLLFGMLGVWATWRFAKRVLSASGALIATFLVAISPWHLYASTTARYYSLVYLWAVLAFWLIPEAYDSDRPSRYRLSFLVLLLGTLTHPSFVFPVVGLVLALAVMQKDGSLQWRWPTRTAWTWLWGPYASALGLELIVLRLSGRGSALGNLETRGLMATLRLIPAMVDWMTIVVFAAAAAGAVLLCRSREDGRRRWGLVAILTVVCVFCALFVASFYTGVYADYGIGMLPITFIAAAAFVVLIVGAPQLSAAVTLAAIFVFGAAVAPSTASYLSDGTRFDYRGVYARIERDAPSLAVVTWPVVIQQHYAPRLRVYELLNRPTTLDSLLAREGDLWLVLSVKRYGIVNDDRRLVETWASTHCQFTDGFEHPRFDYRLYRVNLYRCRLPR